MERVEVTQEDLKRRYEFLRDDDLIDLYLNGGLTETAISVIKGIFQARGITEDQIEHYAAGKKDADEDQPGVVTLPFPKLWIGYIFAGVAFSFEVFVSLFDPYSSNITTPITWTINLAGWLYWLYCVERIHLILQEYTKDSYPITPVKAWAFHFIPFFNIYWIAKWPYEIAKFVNARTGRKAMSLSWAGFWLLFSALFLGRGFDPSAGLLGTLLTGGYIVRKISLVVKPETISPVHTEPAA